MATVTFNVIIDHPPVGVSDAYTLNEDSSLSVAAPGILGNDSDPDGQPLTAQLVVGQAHGTLTFNANGSFTYTPPANYNGPDEFWYQVTDGTFVSDPVVVTLTVNPVNDAPVAGNDSYSVNEDNVLTVAASGVLANDSDIDSPTLSAVPLSGPSHGTISLNASGSFTYTPNANYNGSDSFSYKVSDGSLDSNVATVSITVNAVNDAPVAGNDSFSTNEDTALAGNVLGNDTDVEGSALNAILVAVPAHGSLTPNASGSFTYTPNADYNGIDIFTYKPPPAGRTATSPQWQHGHCGTMRLANNDSSTLTETRCSTSPRCRASRRSRWSVPRATTSARAGHTISRQRTARSWPIATSTTACRCISRRQGSRACGGTSTSPPRSM